ncbi:type IV secretion system DNA-binding domain-containing protein [bacterium]|nr:MAG: type IV secretion system DNA-binding domain-containing protein [bacterium]
MRAVSDCRGGCFFADAPEMLFLAKEKIMKPLFAVVVRVIGTGQTNKSAWDKVKNLSSALGIMNLPQSNGLIPLTNEGYDNAKHKQDVVSRETHRSGMILNSDELISLVHLPSSSIRSEKLRRLVKKTKKAPQVSMGNSLMLGENIHQGKSLEVSLSPELRVKHIHICGSTGSGKSHLLLNLIIHDMERGEGLAVLDPHGDLVDEIISHVPENRIKDIILFDPGNPEYTIGLNILEAQTETDRNVIASDLVAAFKRLSTSWGDQMSAVFGNAVQAFVENEKIGSLLDLRMFLINKEYRETFLETVRDEEIRYFWKNEYPLLKGNTLASILTRLDTFFRPKIIRRIIEKREGLDFKQIINEKKIFIAKLSHGLIGKENSSLLGSLLVSKIHQAVLSRQTESHRSNFWLYIDEFQDFITPTMSAVLSGARKFNLGLILAHQGLRQLWDADTELAHSVITNAGTRVYFRLSEFDAEKVQEGFSYFTKKDFLSLGVGEAICRIDNSENDFNLRTHAFNSLSQNDVENKSRKILNLMRERYGHRPKTAQYDQIETKRNEPILPVVSHKEVSNSEEVDFHKTTLVDDSKVSEHRYLQTLIKRIAEERGYRAVIEEPTEDGRGRVDVGLEKDGVKIACEISITTNAEHEVQNIKKCLVAGYGVVILCAYKKLKLKRIQELASELLTQSDQKKALFFEPDALIDYLDSSAESEAKHEKRIKGYRVRVEHNLVEENERTSKRESIAKVVLDSMRRIKQ